MAKVTVATLTERLDNAGRIIKAMEARMVALEAQDVKTRKQLWYLQKIAKGEFSIGSKAAKPDTPVFTGDEIIEAEHLLAF